MSGNTRNFLNGQKNEGHIRRGAKYKDLLLKKFEKIFILGLKMSKYICYITA